MDVLDLALLPLGRRITVLRIYAGDTVADVAERWGTTKWYVYRVEAGDKEPRPPEVKDMYERVDEVTGQLAALRAAEPPQPKDPAQVRDEVGEVLGARERQRRGQGDRSKGRPKG